MLAFYNNRRKTKSSHSNCSPPAELIVWHAFIHDTRHGIRFSRDVIIGDHIITLISRHSRVAVEYDTPEPSKRSLEDHARIEALLERGYEIVFVTTDEIQSNLACVISRILAAANRRHRKPVKTSAMRITA